jgi:hypothetical protein
VDEGILKHSPSKSDRTYVRSTNYFPITIVIVTLIFMNILDWPEESPYQLMMNRVEWKYPIKRREFVALDVVHRPSMTMISKSALSPLRPGGSRYQSIVPLDENTPYVDPVDPVKRPLVRAVQVHFSYFLIFSASCDITFLLLAFFSTMHLELSPSTRIAVN